jgi:hypothetical protein
MTPGRLATFIASVIAESSRWATAGSMAFAAAGADDDDGEGVGVLAQLASSIIAAAMASRARQRIVIIMASHHEWVTIGQLIIREGTAARADMALTVWVTDWSGRDYAEDSGLQRTMITEAMAALSFSPEEWVLDIGCGDGFLTRAIADLVPRGGAVGADASRRMITTAHAAAGPSASGPWFVVADGRRLPFTARFDAYEPIAGRPGLFRFTQMRAELRR